MKKQNQVPRKKGRTKAKSAQPKAVVRRTINLPATAARLVRQSAQQQDMSVSELASSGLRRAFANDQIIITKPTSASELPGAVPQTDTSIKTGAVEWTAAQLAEALSSRRFLVTHVSGLHRELAASGGALDRFYGEFLQLLPKTAVATLRYSVPLYWQPLQSDRLALVSVRGALPATCGADFGRRSRTLLEAELRRRAINQRMCETLDNVELICDRGSPSQIKALDYFLKAVCLLCGGGAK